MNTYRLCALATVLSITLLVLTPLASAQSAAVLRANVPFDFYVADKLLPAGTYLIQAVNNDVLRFRDQAGKSTFLMIHGRNDNDDLKNSRLLFRVYGNTSFLANVYWQGYSTGGMINKTRHEIELAQKATDPQSVVVAGK